MKYNDYIKIKKDNKMKKKTLSIAYIALTAMFGLFGAGWLLSLLLEYYNASTNGFVASGATLTAVSIVLFVFIVAAFIVRWKLVGKNEDAKIAPKALYGVIAVMIFVSGIMSMIKLFSSKQYITSTMYYVFALLSTSFSFVVALFFALKLTRFEKKTEQFSLIVPVWLLFSIGASYFNTAYTYTSFTRAVMNLAIAAMLLFTMAEIREYIGRKHFVLLSVSSAAATVLGTTALVSRFIFIIARSAEFSFSDCQETAIFAMLIYVYASSVFKNHTIEKEPPKAEAETPETPPKTEQTE